MGAEPSNDLVDFINEVLENTPDSWDDDASADSIALAYVRTLEDRVKALGGTLERWDEDAITGAGSPATDWTQPDDHTGHLLFVQAPYPFTNAKAREASIGVGITGAYRKYVDASTARAMAAALVQMARRAERNAALPTLRPAVPSTNGVESPPEHVAPLTPPSSGGAGCVWP